jgi:hypothetical protein
MNRRALFAVLAGAPFAFSRPAEPMPYVVCRLNSINGPLVRVCCKTGQVLREVLGWAMSKNWRSASVWLP